MRRFRSLPWLLASTARVAFASPPAWCPGLAESTDVADHAFSDPESIAP
jgi:hypothetical protein